MAQGRVYGSSLRHLTSHPRAFCILQIALGCFGFFCGPGAMGNVKGFIIIIAAPWFACA